MQEPEVTVPVFLYARHQPVGDADSVQKAGYIMPEFFCNRVENIIAIAGFNPKLAVRAAHNVYDIVVIQRSAVV